MKILKLSLNSETLIFVNFDKVTDFSPNKEGKTMICFGSENYHFSVLETSEEIMKMLQNLKP